MKINVLDENGKPYEKELTPEELEELNQAQTTEEAK